MFIMLHHAVITALSKTNQAIKHYFASPTVAMATSTPMAHVDGPQCPRRNQCVCNLKFLYSPLRPGCSIELSVPIN